MTPRTVPPMPLQELWVEGYRSIRALRLSLALVTVVVGPNGSGKTNLYRALRLLSAAAEGTLARSLAEEGGLPSVLWAGTRKKNAPARFTTGVALEDLAYELSCGPMPPPQGPLSADRLCDVPLPDRSIVCEVHPHRIELMESADPVGI
jgi:predicted ATPase